MVATISTILQRISLSSPDGWLLARPAKRKQRSFVDFAVQRQGLDMSFDALRKIGWLSPSFKEKLRKGAKTVGFDTTDWVRTVMYDRCFAFVRGLNPSSLDVLEISAGPQWAREFKFKTYESTSYPGFDICSEVLPRQFDLIIADQVFEHLPWPYRAGRNVHSMLRPGGTFVIATPFLLRVHGSPIDCNRWTRQGLNFLLQECGFAEDQIQTDAWGNRDCVKANLDTWRKRGFTGSLVNEEDFPIMVWAFARKAPGIQDG